MILTWRGAAKVGADPEPLWRWAELPASPGQSRLPWCTYVDFHPVFVSQLVDPKLFMKCEAIAPKPLKKDGFEKLEF